MKVENQIQFAHVSEVFVQNLYKTLHQLKNNQFVLVLVDNSDEIKTREPLVNYLVLLVVQKVAHLRITSYHHLIHLSNSQ